jgi:hypothetical protein
VIDMCSVMSNFTLALSLSLLNPDVFEGQTDFMIFENSQSRVRTGPLNFLLKTTG